MVRMSYCNTQTAHNTTKSSMELLCTENQLFFSPVHRILSGEVVFSKTCTPKFCIVVINHPQIVSPTWLNLIPPTTLSWSWPLTVNFVRFINGALPAATNCSVTVKTGTKKTQRDVWLHLHISLRPCHFRPPSYQSLHSIQLRTFCWSQRSFSRSNIRWHGRSHVRHDYELIV